MHPSMSTNSILRKIDIECNSDQMESMADRRTPTASDDRPSKPVTILCVFLGFPRIYRSFYLGSEPVMPNRVGWCEGTEKVILDQSGKVAEEGERNRGAQQSHQRVEQIAMPPMWCGFEGDWTRSSGSERNEKI